MTTDTSPRAPDTSRPEGHVDGGEPLQNVHLSPLGWLRWTWRQLTSMRTALMLLLLLALAAVPGSLVPQRSSDPNGVSQLLARNPGQGRVLEFFQLFNVYTSPWFSAIYLLLFVSLIGCVIPRIRHHAKALAAKPPVTPVNLSRLPAHQTRDLIVLDPAEVLDELNRELRRQRYRTAVYTDSRGRTSISAERGYLRETGNLLFHIALIGVLLTVAVGAGFKYTGQRVVVEGQTFVNSRLAFDSFDPGRFVTDGSLAPFSLGLSKLKVSYVQNNRNAIGMVSDYTASVTVAGQTGEAIDSTIKVNQPLSVDGNDIYLLGNGYAPQLTVRDPAGKIVFKDTVPFLPQDANLTSLGVVKVPDGLAKQVGFLGFLYPSQANSTSGASFSNYPDLINPVVSLNVYTGDLGLNSGTPRSAYALDTSRLTQIAGPSTPVHSLTLTPGKKVSLPNGLGSIELGAIPRFASFEIAHDPTQYPMFGLAALVLAALAGALFVPRRRIWIRAQPTAAGVHLEFAALARGDDPRLDAALAQLSTFPHQKGTS
jgi:cytochrome c biogenesis protein